MESGDDVMILSGSDGSGAPGPVAEERVEGLRVLRLPPQDRRWRLSLLEGRDATARAALAACVADTRREVVHVHHWHNVTSDAVAAARAAGAATVVTLHDFFATCPLFFRLPDDATPCAAELARETCVRCLGRLIGDAPAAVHGHLGARELRYRSELALAGAVLALSEPQAAYLARIPWLAGITFHALPIPAPRIEAAGVPGRRAAGGPLRLLSFGGLVPAKGLHTLVDACEGMVAAERVSIDHFGRILDEGYRGELAGRARRVRLALRGAYTKREMAERFPSYDLAVFPSFYMETHGLAVDEALALGLPVLVSDRGALPLRVGGRGLVFPAGDVAALRAILERFVSDPGALADLRRGSPPPPARMEDHRAALRAIYQRAIAAKPAPGLSPGASPSP
jgi:glycosyltransferase involved in cell wall biosynthesis